MIRQIPVYSQMKRKKFEAIDKFERTKKDNRLQFNHRKIRTLWCWLEAVVANVCSAAIIYGDYQLPCSVYWRVDKCIGRAVTPERSCEPMERISRLAFVPGGICAGGWHRSAC